MKITFKTDSQITLNRNACREYNSYLQLSKNENYAFKLTLDIIGYERLIYTCRRLLYSKF